ncbi:MAG: cytochrome c biogenesis protein CcsA [Fibrobacter sp.]|nr:cytochrome c biogenesis protein CcsA [Fibrobacter sp.]
MASLRVTAAVLVAFLVLTFWGVLAQANAEASGLSASVAIDRFFDSYIIWMLGVIPLPAFKGLALLAAVNLVASLMCRMPRGFKNAGLWMMHLALLVLLVGGVVGSEIKREYNGFDVFALNSTELPESSETAQKVKFYAANDSLGAEPVNLDESVLLEGWPYYVHFRGELRLSEDKVISMYKVYYDPLHFVPYAFMALFLLGAVFHYTIKVRGGKASARVLKLLPFFAVLVATLPMKAQASVRPIPVGDGLSATAPVLVDSAVRPFDSFARGFLDDLSGKTTYKCREADACEGKLTAREVALLLVNAPESAQHLALFKVLRGDVSEALHLPPEKRYVSFAELNAGRDMLQLYASRNDEHPATLEMKRLYSNVRLYESVSDGSAFSIVTRNTPAVLSVNPHRLKAEVAYHWLKLTLWSFVFALLACILASVNTLYKSRKLDVAANMTCMMTSAVLLVLFAMRAYVAARPPMSSLYEIVLMVSLLLMAFETGAFLFCKNRTYTLMVPVTLMASVLLFFAKFVLESGDTFQPIPAVLNSSVFLTIHVFTIALGFAGMILSGVVAHLVLFRSARDKTVLPSSEFPKGSPLYLLLYGTLVFGAVFTVVGTLLGGVWADFAWGRFWGFDPKECGALFVILWAMLALHLRAGKLVLPRGFALLNSFNVIVTFLCWFGINLLGVGLHSYGFQSGSVMWLAVFVGVDLFTIFILCRFLPRAT